LAERRLSSTSVPIRFRKPPTSPGKTRDLAPEPEPTASPSSPLRRHGQSPSIEFKKSREFRPLYLVERNRKSDEIDEMLPALPSSGSPSRNSSPPDTETEAEYESAVESAGYESACESPHMSSGETSDDPFFDPLSAVTDLISPHPGPELQHPELAHREIEEVTDSGQVTPKASDFATGVPRDQWQTAGPRHDVLAAALEHAQSSGYDSSSARSSRIASPLAASPFFDDAKMNEVLADRTEDRSPAKSSSLLQGAALGGLIGGVAAAALHRRDSSSTERRLSDVATGEQAVEENVAEEPRQATPEPEPSVQLDSKAKGKRKSKGKRESVSETPLPTPVEETPAPYVPTFVENEDDWAKNKPGSITADDDTLVGEPFAGPSTLPKDHLREKILESTAPHGDQNTEVRRSLVFDEADAPVIDAPVPEEPEPAVEKDVAPVPAVVDAPAPEESQEPATEQPATVSKGKKKKSKKNKRASQQQDVPPALPEEPVQPEVAPAAEPQQAQIEQDIPQPASVGESAQKPFNVMDFLVKDDGSLTPDGTTAPAGFPGTAAESTTTATVEQSREIKPEPEVVVPAGPAPQELSTPPAVLNVMDFLIKDDEEISPDEFHETTAEPTAKPASPPTVVQIPATKSEQDAELPVDAAPQQPEPAVEVPSAVEPASREVATAPVAAPATPEPARSSWGSSLWGAIGGWSSKKKMPDSAAATPERQVDVVASPVVEKEVEKEMGSRDVQGAEVPVLEEKVAEEPAVSVSEPVVPASEPVVPAVASVVEKSVEPEAQHPEVSEPKTETEEEVPPTEQSETPLEIDTKAPAHEETSRDLPAAVEDSTPAQQATDFTPPTAFFGDNGQPFSFGLPQVSTAPTQDVSKTPVEPVSDETREPVGDVAAPSLDVATEDSQSAENTSRDLPTESDVKVGDSETALPVGAVESALPVADAVPAPPAADVEPAQPAEAAESTSTTSSENNRERQINNLEDSEPASVPEPAVEDTAKASTEDGQPVDVATPMTAETDKAAVQEPADASRDEAFEDAVTTTADDLDTKPAVVEKDVSAVEENKPAEEATEGSIEPTTTSTDLPAVEEPKSAEEATEVPPVTVVAPVEEAETPQPTSSKKKAKKDKKAKRGSVQADPIREPEVKATAEDVNQPQNDVVADTQILPLTDDLPQDVSAADQLHAQEEVVEPAASAEADAAPTTELESVKGSDPVEQVKPSESQAEALPVDQAAAIEEEAAPSSKKKKKNKKAKRESAQLSTPVDTQPSSPSLEASRDLALDEPVQLPADTTSSEQAQDVPVEDGKEVPEVTPEAEESLPTPAITTGDVEVSSTPITEDAVSESLPVEETQHEVISSDPAPSDPATTIAVAEDDWGYTPKKKSKKAKGKKGIQTPEQQAESVAAPETEGVEAPNTTSEADNAEKATDQVVQDAPAESSIDPLQPDQEEVEAQKSLEEPSETTAAEIDATSFLEGKPLDDVSSLLEQEKPSEEAEAPTDVPVEEEATVPLSKKEKKKRKGKKSKDLDVAPAEEVAGDTERAAAETATAETVTTEQLHEEPKTEIATPDVTETVKPEEPAPEQLADEPSSRDIPDTTEPAQPSEPAQVEPLQDAPQISETLAETPAETPAEPEPVSPTASKKDKKKRKKKGKNVDDEPSTPTSEPQQETTEPAVEAPETEVDTNVTPAQEEAPQEQPQAEETRDELVAAEIPLPEESDPMEELKSTEESKPEEALQQVPDVDNIASVPEEIDQDPVQPSTPVVEEPETTAISKKAKKKKGKKGKSVDIDSPTEAESELKVESEPSTSATQDEQAEQTAAADVPSVPVETQANEITTEMPNEKALPETTSTVEGAAAPAQDMLESGVVGPVVHDSALEVPEPIVQEPSPEATKPAVQEELPSEVAEPATPEQPVAASKKSKKKKGKKGSTVTTEPSTPIFEEPPVIQDASVLQAEIEPAQESEQANTSVENTLPESTPAGESLPFQPESSSEPRQVEQKVERGQDGPTIDSSAPTAEVQPALEPIDDISAPQDEAQSISEPVQEKILPDVSADAENVPSQDAAVTSEAVDQAAEEEPVEPTSKKDKNKKKKKGKAAADIESEQPVAVVEPESAQDVVPSTTTETTELSSEGATATTDKSLEDSNVEAPVVNTPAEVTVEETPAEGLPKETSAPVEETPVVEETLGEATTQPSLAAEGTETTPADSQPQPEASQPTEPVETAEDVAPTSKKSKKKKGKKGKSISEPQTPTTEAELVLPEMMAQNDDALVPEPKVQDVAPQVAEEVAPEATRDVVEEQVSTDPVESVEQHEATPASAIATESTPTEEASKPADELVPTTAEETSKAVEEPVLPATEEASQSVEEPILTTPLSKKDKKKAKKAGRKATLGSETPEIPATPMREAENVLEQTDADAQVVPTEHDVPASPKATSPTDTAEQAPETTASTPLDSEVVPGSSAVRDVDAVQGQEDAITTAEAAPLEMSGEAVVEEPAASKKNKKKNKRASVAETETPLPADEAKEALHVEQTPVTQVSTETTVPDETTVPTVPVETTEQIADAVPEHQDTPSSAVVEEPTPMPEQAQDEPAVMSKKEKKKAKKNKRVSIAEPSSAPETPTEEKELAMPEEPAVTQDANVPQDEEAAKELTTESLDAEQPAPVEQVSEEVSASVTGDDQTTEPVSKEEDVPLSKKEKKKAKKNKRVSIADDSLSDPSTPIEENRDPMVDETQVSSSSAVVASELETTAAEQPTPTQPTIEEPSQVKEQTQEEEPAPAVEESAPGQPIVEEPQTSDQTPVESAPLSKKERKKAKKGKRASVAESDPSTPVETPAQELKDFTFDAPSTSEPRSVEDAKAEIAPEEPVPEESTAPAELELELEREVVPAPVEEAAPALDEPVPIVEEPVPIAEEPESGPVEEQALAPEEPTSTNFPTAEASEKDVAQQSDSAPMSKQAKKKAKRASKRGSVVEAEPSVEEAPAETPELPTGEQQNVATPAAQDQQVAKSLDDKPESVPTTSEPLDDQPEVVSAITGAPADQMQEEETVLSKKEKKKAKKAKRGSVVESEPSEEPSPALDQPADTKDVVADPQEISTPSVAEPQVTETQAAEVEPLAETAEPVVQIEESTPVAQEQSDDKPLEQEPTSMSKEDEKEAKEVFKRFSVAEEASPQPVDEPVSETQLPAPEDVSTSAPAQDQDKSDQKAAGNAETPVGPIPDDRPPPAPIEELPSELQEPVQEVSAPLSKSQKKKAKKAKRASGVDVEESQPATPVEEVQRELVSEAQPVIPSATEEPETQPSVPQTTEEQPSDQKLDDEDTAWSSFSIKDKKKVKKQKKAETEPFLAVEATEEAKVSESQSSLSPSTNSETPIQFSGIPTSYPSVSTDNRVDFNDARGLDESTSVAVDDVKEDAGGHREPVVESEQQEPATKTAEVEPAVEDENNRAEETLLDEKPTLDVSNVVPADDVPTMEHSAPVQSEPVLESAKVPTEDIAQELPDTQSKAEPGIPELVVQDPQEKTEIKDELATTIVAQPAQADEADPSATGPSSKKKKKKGKKGKQEPVVEQPILETSTAEVAHEPVENVSTVQDTPPTQPEEPTDDKPIPDASQADAPQESTEKNVSAQDVSSLQPEESNLATSDVVPGTREIASPEVANVEEPVVLAQDQDATPQAGVADGKSTADITEPPVVESADDGHPDAAAAAAAAAAAEASAVPSKKDKKKKKGKKQSVVSVPEVSSDQLESSAPQVEDRQETAGDEFRSDGGMVAGPSVEDPSKAAVEVPAETVVGAPVEAPIEVEESASEKPLQDVAPTVEVSSEPQQSTSSTTIEPEASTDVQENITEQQIRDVQPTTNVEFQQFEEDSARPLSKKDKKKAKKAKRQSGTATPMDESLPAAQPDTIEAEVPPQVEPAKHDVGTESTHSLENNAQLEPQQEIAPSSIEKDTESMLREAIQPAVDIIPQAEEPMAAEKSVEDESLVAKPTVDEPATPVSKKGKKGKKSKDETGTTAQVYETTPEAQTKETDVARAELEEPVIDTAAEQSSLAEDVAPQEDAVDAVTDAQVHPESVQPTEEVFKSGDTGITGTSQQNTTETIADKDVDVSSQAEVPSADRPVENSATDEVQLPADASAEPAQPAEDDWGYTSSKKEKKKGKKSKKPDALIPATETAPEVASTQKQEPVLGPAMETDRDQPEIIADIPVPTTPISDDVDARPLAVPTADIEVPTEDQGSAPMSKKDKKKAKKNKNKAPNAVTPIVEEAPVLQEESSESAVPPGLVDRDVVKQDLPVVEPHDEPVVEEEVQHGPIEEPVITAVTHQGAATQEPVVDGTLAEQPVSEQPAAEATSEKPAEEPITPAVESSAPAVESSAPAVDDSAKPATEEPKGDEPVKVEPSIETSIVQQDIAREEPSVESQREIEHVDSTNAPDPEQEPPIGDVATPSVSKKKNKKKGKKSGSATPAVEQSGLVENDPIPVKSEPVAAPHVETAAADPSSEMLPEQSDERRAETEEPSLALPSAVDEQPTVTITDISSIEDKELKPETSTLDTTDPIPLVERDVTIETPQLPVVEDQTADAKQEPAYTEAPIPGTEEGVEIAEPVLGRKLSKKEKKKAKKNATPILNDEVVVETPETDDKTAEDFPIVEPVDIHRVEDAQPQTSSPKEQSSMPPSIEYELRREPQEELVAAQEGIPVVSRKKSKKDKKAKKQSIVVDVPTPIEAESQSPVAEQSRDMDELHPEPAVAEPASTVEAQEQSGGISNNNEVAPTPFSRELGPDPTYTEDRSTPIVTDVEPLVEETGFPVVSQEESESTKLPESTQGIASESGHTEDPPMPTSSPDMLLSGPPSESIALQEEPEPTKQLENPELANTASFVEDDVAAPISRKASKKGKKTKKPKITEAEPIDESSVSRNTQSLGLEHTEEPIKPQTDLTTTTEPVADEDTVMGEAMDVTSSVSPDDSKEDASKTSPVDESSAIDRMIVEPTDFTAAATSSEAPVDEASREQPGLSERQPEAFQHTLETQPFENEKSSQETQIPTPDTSFDPEPKTEQTFVEKNEPDFSLSRSTSKKSKKKGRKGSKVVDDDSSETPVPATIDETVPETTILETSSEQPLHVPEVLHSMNEVATETQPHGVTVQENTEEAKQFEPEPVPVSVEHKPEETSRDMPNQVLTDVPVPQQDPEHASTTEVQPGELSPSLKAIQAEAADLRQRSEALDRAVESKSIFDVVSKLSKKDKKAAKKGKGKNMDPEPTTPAVESEAAVETKDSVEPVPANEPNFDAVASQDDTKATEKDQTRSALDEPSNVSMEEQVSINQPTLSEQPVHEFASVQDRTRDDPSLGFEKQDMEVREPTPVEPDVADNNLPPAASTEFTEPVAEKLSGPSRKLSKKEKKKAKLALSTPDEPMFEAENLTPPAPVPTRDVDTTVTERVPPQESSTAIETSSSILELQESTSHELPPPSRKTSIEELAPFPLARQDLKSKPIDSASPSTNQEPIQEGVQPPSTAQETAVIVEDAPVPSRKLSKSEKKKQKKKQKAQEDAEVLPIPVERADETPAVSDEHETVHSEILPTTADAREVPAAMDDGITQPLPDSQVQEESIELPLPQKSDEEKELEAESAPEPVTGQESSVQELHDIAVPVPVTVPDNDIRTVKTDVPDSAAEPAATPISYPSTIETQETTTEREISAIPEEIGTATASALTRKQSKKDKKKGKKKETDPDTRELEILEDVPMKSAPMEEHPLILDTPTDVKSTVADTQLPPIADVPSNSVAAYAQSLESGHHDIESAETTTKPGDELVPSSDRAASYEHAPVSETKQRGAPTESLPFEHKGINNTPVLPDSEPKKIDVGTKKRTMNIPESFLTPKPTETSTEMPSPTLNKKGSKKHKLAALFERDSTEQTAASDRALRKDGKGSVKNLAEQYEIQSRSTTPGHLTASQSVSRSASDDRLRSGSPRLDVDFAATVAAGLTEAGFNPGYVINDGLFSRPGSAQESQDPPIDDEVATARSNAGRSKFGSMGRISPPRSTSPKKESHKRGMSGNIERTISQLTTEPVPSPSKAFFDPMYVLNDPAFTRRKTPPGVLEEADPAELWSSSKGKNPKARKRDSAPGSPVKAEMVTDVSPTRMNAQVAGYEKDSKPESAKLQAEDYLRSPNKQLSATAETSRGLPVAENVPGSRFEVPEQDQKSKKAKRQDKTTQDSTEDTATGTPVIETIADVPLAVETQVASTSRGIETEPSLTTGLQPPPLGPIQASETTHSPDKQRKRKDDKVESEAKVQTEIQGKKEQVSEYPFPRVTTPEVIQDTSEREMSRNEPEIADAVRSPHKRRTHPVSFHEDQPEEKRLHKFETTKTRSTSRKPVPTMDPAWSFAGARNDAAPVTDSTAREHRQIAHAKSPRQEVHRTVEPTTPRRESSQDASARHDIEASPSLPEYPTHDTSPPPVNDYATKERASYLFDSSPSTRAYGTPPVEAPITPARYSLASVGSPIMDSGESPAVRSRKPPTDSHKERSLLTQESKSKEPYQSIFGGPIEQREVPPSPTQKSLRTPGNQQLDTIKELSPEDSHLHKKPRPITDVGAPDRGVKSPRRTEGQRSFSDRMRSPPPVTPSPSNHRGVPTALDYSGRQTPSKDSPWHQVHENADRAITLSPTRRLPHSPSASLDPLKQSSIAERTSPGMRSERSISNIARIRSPEYERPLSSTSTHSVHSLRRMERSQSGDLRSAARLGMVNAPDAKSVTPSLSGIALAAGATAAIAGAAAASNYDPVRGTGKGRSVSMAETFVSREYELSSGGMLTMLQEAWGEAQGSPISPTRPPSVRKRQSMQILDLQSQLEQLADNNDALAEEKRRIEDSLQSAQHQRQVDEQVVAEAVGARDRQIHQQVIDIAQLKDTIQRLQEEVTRLTELNNNLTEANHNLTHNANERYAHLQSEGQLVHQQWQSSQQELDGLRKKHEQMTRSMEGAIRDEIGIALDERNAEIDRLTTELASAREQIKGLQKQILASKKPGESFLTIRDEDYFDSACQQLCQHVQQWVLRFSKFSDTRACRLSSEIQADTRLDTATRQKIDTRLDSAILDGSDVDSLLADRVKRRDVFMSVVMTMIWEYVFTRYLFGMDREQRQKLKSLEKTLGEVGE
jgi:hypothetical protein